MSNGFDGSIRIDSSIDTGGFDKGMKKIASSAGSAMGKILAEIGAGVSDVLLTIGAVLTTAAAIGVALGTAGIAALAFGYELFQQLEKAISSTSTFYDKVLDIRTAFDGVKGALLAAFTPLLTAALPYIILIADWLTKMLNTIGMILAAWTGQKTVLQYDAEASAALARNTEKTAVNTDKARKAAKGALAAFDKLNVLAKDTAEAAALPGLADTAAGGPMVFKEVPVDPAVIQGVQNFKENLAGIWTWIQNTWGSIAKWFMENVWNPLVADFNWYIEQWKTNWGFLFGLLTQLWESVKQIWGAVVAWFMDNVINPLIEAFKPVWDFLVIVAHDAYVSLLYIWGLFAKWFDDTVAKPLQLLFAAAWAIVEYLAGQAWDGIIGVWKGAVAWFNTWIAEPLKGIFGAALGGLLLQFTGVFDGIKAVVKGAVNWIIDLVNGMISGITSGVNMIIGSLNGVGTNVPGWIAIPSVSAPHIPHLATGAVIPPNAAFAAILGDQRSGTNIEAPESLIRQIMREEMGSAQPQSINISFDGNLGALVSALHPYIVLENRRIGKSLISSGLDPRW